MKKIQMLIFNRKRIYQVIMVLILTVLSYRGLVGDATPDTFDTFSDTLMIANIMHDQTKNDKNILLQTVSSNDYEKIKQAFLNNTEIENIDYRDYISQIGLHGIVQNFIVDIVPLSNANSLQLLYLINATLFAIVLIVIFTQIDKLLRISITPLLVIIVVFLCPDLIKYGRNLYWCGWILLLPFACSLITINSSIMTSKKRNIYLFLIAFGTCLLKLLFSYEFISTIMISMMIPYIFYATQNKMSLKDMFAMFLWPFMGAIVSFIIALGVQFLQNYTVYQDFAVTLKHFKEVILIRIIGDDNASLQVLRDAASASKFDVIKSYFNSTMFKFSGLSFSYSNMTMIILITTFVGYKYNYYINDTKIKMRLQALIITTIISILAPLSWFFLATPHAYIHTAQCMVLWFVPYMILGFVLFVYILKIKHIQETV